MKKKSPLHFWPKTNLCAMYIHRFIHIELNLQVCACALSDLTWSKTFATKNINKLNKYINRWVFVTTNVTVEWEFITIYHLISRVKTNLTQKILLTRGYCRFCVYFRYMQNRARFTWILDLYNSSIFCSFVVQFVAIDAVGVAAFFCICRCCKIV